MSIRKIGGIVIDADTLDKEDSAAFEATGVAADLMSDHLTPDAHHAVFTNTEHDVVARHPLVNLDSAVCSETEAATIAAIVAFQASDTLRNSNDTQREKQSTTPVKAKETKLNENLPACRIKFNLRRVLGGPARGQIYKNGGAIGTLRETNSDTYVTYTEDFTGFVANDLIQIYIWNINEGYEVWTNNFRLYYDVAITHIGGKELVSTLPSTKVISVTNQDP